MIQSKFGIVPGRAGSWLFPTGQLVLYVLYSIQLPVTSRPFRRQTQMAEPPGSDLNLLSP